MNLFLLFTLMSVNLIFNFYLIDGQLTKCLESLNAAKGTITYKVGRPIDGNERCAWIIRGGGKSSFDLSFASADPQLAQDGQVTVTGFGRNQTPKELVFGADVTHQPFEDVSVIVVTYHTVANPNAASKGFTLTYEAVDGGNSVPPSTNSIDAIFGNGHLSGYFKHPNTGNYSAGELSTFLFTLPNNVFNDTRTSDILFVAEHLETRCKDILTVYEYTPGRSGVWNRKGEICGKQTFNDFPAKEMVLAVFESDDTIERAGFGVLHNVCP